jgi:outer membrane murein-binding lipoprotein Lpp
MAGFPPDKGEPWGNGYDSEERHLRTLVDRLDSRTASLETTVATLRTDISHLPSKTTLAVIVSVMIAVIAVVAGAYWNGTVSKFETVNARIEGIANTINAKFETVNTKLDALGKQVDRIQPAPAAQPTSHKATK